MSARIDKHAECSSRPKPVGLVAEVLVVDDNPIDRLRAGRLIEQDARCHVSYAEDGTQAIACLANRPISVIVTDLQMEGMDGLNLVRAIRTQYSSVPIIVMTGHGSEEAAMEALRVGATDYVPKQRLAQDLALRPRTRPPHGDRGQPTAALPGFSGLARIELSTEQRPRSHPPCARVPSGRHDPA